MLACAQQHDGVEAWRGGFRPTSSKAFAATLSSDHCNVTVSRGNSDASCPQMTGRAHEAWLCQICRFQFKCFDKHLKPGLAHYYLNHVTSARIARSAGLYYSCPAGLTGRPDRFWASCEHSLSHVGVAWNHQQLNISRPPLSHPDGFSLWLHAALYFHACALKPVSTRHLLQPCLGRAVHRCATGKFM